MQELLIWKESDVFMRPKFKLEHNGLTAYQCFWDNDTKGVTLPEGLEDPEVLEDLVQAKKNREFTIDQWRETYQKGFHEYPIFTEEYFDHPGMTVDLHWKIFEKEPCPGMLFRLMKLGLIPERDDIYKFFDSIGWKPSPELLQEVSNSNHAHSTDE
jgi:hypothetical protein